MLETHERVLSPITSLKKRFLSVGIAIVIIMIPSLAFGASPTRLTDANGPDRHDGTAYSHALRYRFTRTQRRVTTSGTLVALTRTHLRHGVGIVARPLAHVVSPTPNEGYVMTLIRRDFPPRAWHDAAVVAWCESRFQFNEIHYDSNGTHDRGLFQLNDGGTEQYLLQLLGKNPLNVNLAYNPVLNVRAAALLYARDGWSQWSCASALA